MQVAIIASGSRGDVQPHVALGLGLKRAGHAVRVVTSRDFEDLVTSHELDFFDLGGSVDALPDSVYMVGSIPHAWLLPRMAAVVHHGGAGTTAAGLSAGVPSIVTPFMGDQAFWANRVFELGVGPKPIARRHLSVSHLSDAIEMALGDDAMRDRAADLGGRIRSEDGVAKAVALIEQAYGER